jgi:hypothetical protein
MDVGGLPPIPTSFHFGSFFPSFQVPDLQGRFEALNNVFRDRHSRKCPLLGREKCVVPDRPFQWAIMHLKWRSYAKVTTPGS